MRRVGQTELPVEVFDAHQSAATTWGLHQVVRNDFETNRTRGRMHKRRALRGFSCNWIVLCGQFRRTGSQRSAAALEPIDIDWIAVFIREFDANRLRITVRNPFVRVERHAADDGRMVQDQPNIGRTHGCAFALADQPNFRRRPIDHDHVVVIGRAAGARWCSAAFERLRNHIVTAGFQKDEQVDEDAVTGHADGDVFRVRKGRDGAAVATHPPDEEIHAGNACCSRKAEVRPCFAAAVRVIGVS